jgi:hypothetical protein
VAGKIKQIWDALSACFRANEESLTSGQVVAWVNSHYPENDFNPVTLKAQLYRSCSNVLWAQKYNAPKIIFYDKRTKTYSRLDTSVETMDDPVLLNSSRELEDDEKEPSESLLETEDQSDLLVGVEAQLRDYLAKNLGKLEKGLTFWNDSPPSVEFAIDGRRIDILARDVDGNAVVVELKRGKAYDRVAGQALLYQALVAAKFSLSKVRVILVASEIAMELRLACSRQEDFKLFEYELTMQLNPISSAVAEEEG